MRSTYGLSRRTMTVLLAVLIVAAGVVMVVAGEAKASDPLVCGWNSGDLCLYMDAGYQRCARHFDDNDSNYNNDHFEWSGVNGGCDWIRLNDEVSSIKNRGNHCDTYHYRHAYYVHWERRVKKKWSVWDLSSSDHNDELSSHRWVNCH